MNINVCWFSDNLLFWVLQGAILLLTAVSFVRDWIRRKRAGLGGATARIARGAESMAVFYGFSSALITGPLVLIDISVDVVKHFRVFWVMIDTVAVVYVCLFNAWFRNWLIGIRNHLINLENR